MTAEAEFELEATQMLRSMGLELDADTLNFFQSDNLTSGSEKWKEGLRKPSPSGLTVRRSHTGELLGQTAAEPRNEVDGRGLAMRRHVPVNGTISKTDCAGSKLLVPSTNLSPQAKPSYSYGSHQRVARAKSVPQNRKGNPGDSQSAPPVNNDRRRRSLSPSPQYLHYSSTAKSPATSDDAVEVPTTKKPATVVKVKSTHIHVPVPVPGLLTAPVGKLSSVTSKPVAISDKRAAPDDTQTTVPSSSSGTKVLYACKPSLKLLSVSTSTSTKVQSVADCSLPRHQPPDTCAVRNSNKPPPAASLHHSSSNPPQKHSTTTFSSGIPQLKHPPLSTAPVHVDQAYDRLEGYQQRMQSSPEPPNFENTGSHLMIAGATHSASPTHSSGINGDASKGSIVSQRSTGNSEKQMYGQRPIPRLQRRSSTPVLSGSGSSSRTPTPTTGDTHMKRSPSNFSGVFYHATTDESSQGLTKLTGAASTCTITKDKAKRKLTLDYRTTSASPEPEIIAMNILATDTVQALSTLMEVVTPATSTENLEGKAPLLQMSKTEHCSLSDRSLPKQRLSVGEHAGEQVPMTGSHSSLNHSDPKKRYSVDESVMVHGLPPTAGRVNNHPASSVSIPTHTSIKPRQSLPLKRPKQGKISPKVPPIPAKQRGAKYLPMSPTENCFSLLSPMASHSEMNKSRSTPFENRLIPRSNAEQHDTKHPNQEPVSNEMSSMSLEDKDDFFGYCHQCSKAVVGEETGCLALGKVFHTACFSCSNCGNTLCGKTFYTVNTDILCEVDYLKCLQRCCFCNQRIKEKVLRAFDEMYHPDCFRCTVCGVCLDGVPYAGKSHDKVYCIEDYHKLYAPPCASCGDPIIPQQGKTKNVRVIVKDKYYHVKCYKCEDCGKLFASTSGAKKQKSFMIDDHLFCQKCHVDHGQGCVRTTVL